MVKVKPYVWQPWLLYNGGLSDKADAEQIKSLAVWYGKAAICVENEAQ